MKRYYYSDPIATFLAKDRDAILGALVANNEYPLETPQRDAWLVEIEILKRGLIPYALAGQIYFEYSVPRLGRRIDVVMVLCSAIFVIEFKVNESKFASAAIDQVCDYALDLKNFHETSHRLPIAPILIATEAAHQTTPPEIATYDDGMFFPIRASATCLADVIDSVLHRTQGPTIVPADWEFGRYCPTPTIIEAATSLYNGHSVVDISRSDASALNLTKTSDAISSIIATAKSNSEKAICFVTGVPGAGKTLVGLNIATKHIDKSNELYSVFLSGNGPLVSILREALARDKIRREKEFGRKEKKGKVLSK